jgi:hypothetical protein
LDSWLRRFVITSPRTCRRWLRRLWVQFAASALFAGAGCYDSNRESREPTDASASEPLDAGLDAGTTRPSAPDASSPLAIPASCLSGETLETGGMLCSTESVEDFCERASKSIDCPATYAAGLAFSCRGATDVPLARFLHCNTCGGATLTFSGIDSGVHLHYDGNGKLVGVTTFGNGPGELCPQLGTVIGVHCAHSEFQPTTIAGTCADVTSAGAN